MSNFGVIGDVVKAAFYQSAAENPRGTAKTVVIIGVVVAALCFFIGWTNHNPSFYAIGIFSIPVAAFYGLYARYIGWQARR